jgi:histidine ammonia-lyase
MGCTAALKARAILDNVERILALELLAAAQGIDFRKQAIGAHAHLGQGTGAAYGLVRGLVPFIDADTVLYPYMEAVYRVVADGSLVAAVNGAMHEGANPS